MKRHWQLLFLLLILAGAWGESAAWESAITGEKVTFSDADAPRWTFAGAPEGKNLLLLDVLKGEILKFSAQGKLLQRISDRGFEVPAHMQRAGRDTIWVEGEDGRLVVLNNQLQPQGKPIDLTNQVKSPLGALISVLLWVPLDDSNILVAGDLQRGKSATGAILRVPLAEPSKFQVLWEIGVETPAHRSLLVGLPLLAAVNGQPFFLEVGAVPRIVKPDGRVLRIVRVTSAGRQTLSPPEFPARFSMDTTAALFKELERTPYPAGIYGSNGFLYVLMRTPTAEGTLWTLLKIDPRTEDVVWNREIESSANHLFAVPGNDYWAFVEKGPVKGPGNQQVTGFLRVPAQVVEQP